VKLRRFGVRLRGAGALGPGTGAPGRGLDAPEDTDLVAREEPLEIQLGATPLAVVMRTPGHDVDLAAGFLVSERVIADWSEVLSLRHCRAARDPAAADNVVRVVLADGVEVDWEALRRNLYASSSCGICGKATLDNALAVAPPLDDASRFDAARLPGLAARLEAAQPGFARTGGLHAAALFDAEGRLVVVREDVGRHNAVDKVIGHALREKRGPLAGHGLLVSGRISFEIAQKALAARVPLLAGVSAPSSLAVGLAERAGLTLVAFLRERSFNVYGDVSRIRGALRA
jgi:FdhD protein